jgi:4-diphosphocytidyl-2-C-methyl-D-erythritol kinase
MVYIEAPAKINLHLDVLQRRTDGYHDLVSIFQKVSLCDTMCVSSLKEKGKCRIRGDFKVSEADNLIRKAYDLFSMKTGITGGVGVEVTKRIPEGAGLGGGSSDAAATLLCLQTLFGLELSASDLRDIAVALGSDVFFFVNGPSALVSGRGDIVRPLATRADYEAVIVYPGFSISTKAAYGFLDAEQEKGNSPRLTDERTVIEEYLKDPVSEWKYVNSFASVLTNCYPELSSIIGKLEALGSAYANITGSGSSVIALFEEGRITARMLDSMREEYASVFCVKPLDKNPLPVLQ